MDLHRLLRNSRGICLLGLASLLALTLQLQRCSGQSLTWAGASSNLWSLAGSDANWSNSGGSAAYTDYSDTVFNGGASNTSITVAETVNPSSITFNNLGTDYSFSGASISGTGSVLFTNNGGNVTFNSANSYTGPTTITNGLGGSIAGALTLGNALALQNSTFNDDEDEELGSSVLTFATGISPRIGGLAGDGTVSLTDAGGNPITVTVGGNNASTSYSGVLVGAGAGNLSNGALTKIGTGNLTLVGFNLFNGPTTVSGGTLQLGSGTSQNAGLAGPIVNNATLLVAAPSLVNLAGVSGSGGLIKSGAGTLLIVAPESYAGPTLVSAGILQLAPTAVSGFASSVYPQAGAIDAPTSWYALSLGPGIVNNTLPMTSLQGNQGYAWYATRFSPVSGFTVSFTYSGSTVGNNGGGVGAGGIYMVMQKVPSEQGIQGVEQSENTDSVGVNLNYTSTASQTAYFSDGTTGTKTNLPNPNFLNSGDPINVVVNYNAATSTLAWSLTDTATSTTYTDSQSGVNLATLLGGSNAYLEFNGYTSSGRTYGFMAQQLTNFSYAQSANYNNALPTGTAMTLAGGATLDLDGNSQTFGSLAGAGTVTNSMAATLSTLTVGTDGTSQTFSGLLTNGSGQLGVAKTGTGSWTLTGANTYSGPTTVIAGALLTGAAGVLSPNSSVAVTGGRLDATDGPQTVASLSIGSSGTLNLSVGNVLISSGAATFGVGSTLNISNSAAIVLPDLLMTYLGAANGAFSIVNGLPAADQLFYNTGGSLEIVSSGPPAWIQGNGNWSMGSNWSGGSQPNAAGRMAVLNQSTSNSVAINLDVPVTIGALEFASSTTSYTLSGTNTLIFSNTGSTAQVTLLSGTHYITSAVYLQGGSLDIAGSNNGVLKIGGKISGGGNGESLILDGDGTAQLVLGPGAPGNTYTGSTIVNAGTMIVDSVSAMPTGSSLLIGGGASTIFAPAVAGPALSPGVGAVPEPGTVALVIAGLVFGLGLMRRRNPI